MTKALASVSDGQDIEGISDQYVTFTVGGEVFGFSMSVVLEIIRMPNTVQVPLTPGALIGLANLRGSVLPILDLREILQLEKVEYNDTTRVIVSDAGNPVGLVVDKVARVLSIEPDQIDSGEQVKSSLNAELLKGVIKGENKEPLIQLLDVEALILQEFEAILSASNVVLDGGTPQPEMLEDDDLDDADQLVSFTVQQQEYAFNLMDVEEIVRIPENISKVPRVDEHVLGLMDLRGRLLPLVSLRCLFSLDNEQVNEDARILVINIAAPHRRQNNIGLVVDDVKEVLRVDKSKQDVMPSLLAGNENDCEIDSVCRLNGGKRLVSVLKANALFSHPIIQAAIDARDAKEEDQVIEDDIQSELDEDDDTAQLVVFHLGEQEYGVSIDDVQEITRLPEKMDKVPKTADFIEGMVNLRGTVLPVLDMRTRFEMPKLEASERQRIIVLSLNERYTGFIVDFVAEVIRLPKNKIETAPALSEDQSRIMGRVVNLKESKRMIQVLEVHELLSDQEMTAINFEDEVN